MPATHASPAMSCTFFIRALFGELRQRAHELRFLQSSQCISCEPRMLFPYFLGSNAGQLTTAVMVAGLVSPEPVGGGTTRKRLPSAVTS